MIVKMVYLQIKNNLVCLLLAFMLFSIAPIIQAQQASEQNQEKEQGIDLIWELKIPMRDGVKLNATIYKPQTMEAPLPVIFLLTPYIADSYHDRAYYFSKNGYIFALVDARGRGSSEGKFDPFMQEANDGHDVVEWLARQSWCDGKIAMWGGSYSGYNQWATLKEFPPHLKTIVPAASAFPGVDFPFQKNIWFPYSIQWLTLTSGTTQNSNIFGEWPLWAQNFNELYQEHLPFKELDSLVGNMSTNFQTWISHPKSGAYWDAMNPTNEEFARINMPILTITGHYDGDQPGAMEYYKRHIKQAPQNAREKHYLIIGPWDHPGTRTPRKQVGGITFGEASLLDLNELHKKWYDWTLKNGDKPDFLEKRIAYYVAGAEEWKYADSLNAIADTTLRLYLNSDDGRANDVFHSGSLTQNKPEISKPDQYIYDPRDTRLAEFEQDLKFIENYVTYERDVLNLFGNGLIYHSKPFEKETEISGYLKFVAWIALDAPDTDFKVDIYEITLNGTSIRLATDMMRARYRESLREEKLIEPAEINRYEFNGLYFFSRQIAKGSRLRLILKSPNSILYQKNYNTGGDVMAESGKDTRVVNVTLYHDAEYPSYLDIPIVRSEGEKRK